MGGRRCNRVGRLLSVTQVGRESACFYAVGKETVES